MTVNNITSRKEQDMLGLLVLHNVQYICEDVPADELALAKTTVTQNNRWIP